MSRGDIFVVSAPSGAGKTTLIRRLQAEIQGLHFSVSHTTRRARKGESEGVDYHFVSPAEFEEMARTGGFLESAEVHGQRYGTSTAEVDGPLARGEDVLLDVDTKGAASIKKLRPKAILIFILPPTAQALKDRLAMRAADDEQDLRRRVEAADKEVAALEMYDYCVINDSLERALRDLQAIIRSHRLRRDRQTEQVSEIVRGFDAAKAASAS